MEPVRKPFQGVLNIIKFNWHFYVISSIFLIALFFSVNFFPAPFHFYIWLFFILILSTILVSLFVSFYIYDFSCLYKLDWLDDNDTNIQIVNINAGFDETSILLQSKFKNAALTVLDFYNPETHTEVSIKRARKAYPPFPNTKHITTSNLTLLDNFADKVFVILSAHEIRNEKERIGFFNELQRILKPNGQLLITEHLRDTANFMAYNIGFFHFLSKRTWYKTFKESKLEIKAEQKITPFISTFTLEKHGVTN
jgi:ubiquinone/menaquinone biosynthesis C-methylase UbiE